MTQLERIGLILFLLGMFDLAASQSTLMSILSVILACCGASVFVFSRDKSMELKAKSNMDSPSPHPTEEK